MAEGLRQPLLALTSRRAMAERVNLLGGSLTLLVFGAIDQGPAPRKRRQRTQATTPGQGGRP